MTRCKIYAYCFCQALQAKTSHLKKKIIAETLLTIVTFHLTVVFLDMNMFTESFFLRGSVWCFVKIIYFLIILFILPLHLGPPNLFLSLSLSRSRFLLV